MLQLIESPKINSITSNPHYSILWKGKKVGDVEFQEIQPEHELKWLKSSWIVFGIVGNKMKDPGVSNYGYISSGRYKTIEDVANCLWFYNGLRHRSITSFPMDNKLQNRWYNNPKEWKIMVDKYEKKYGATAEIIKIN